MKIKLHLCAVPLLAERLFFELRRLAPFLVQSPIRLPIEIFPKPNLPVLFYIISISFEYPVKHHLRHWLGTHDDKASFHEDAFLFRGLIH
jgi:hypothetical protein